MLLLDVWMPNYSVNLSQSDKTVFNLFAFNINENYAPLPSPCT